MLMRIQHIIILISLTSIFAHAQDGSDKLFGVVSFKSAQNVYAKFQSTADIQIGDTLFVHENGLLLPALEVKFISSISIVGVPIGEISLEVGQEIQTILKVPKNEERMARDSIVTIIEDQEFTQVIQEKSDKTMFKSSFRGRMSAASYSYFSDKGQGVQQRMRYNFAFRADHINNTRLSLESYIIYRHRIQRNTETAAINQSPFRIYSLAAKYELGSNTEITLGRKINRHLSNVGAMDGLQIHQQAGNFTFGILSGSRPDLQNFSLNLKRFQSGGFVAFRKDSKNGSVDASVAFLEQRFSGKEDRRFLYFQHSNALVRNLYLFTSLELDLLDRIDGVTQSHLRPTSVYFSLRYRASQKLSISASYDARKNVIYLESYRNFIDQIIDESTRQGMRMRFNYRPFKRIIIGASGGYRFQESNPASSKNLYVYITFSQIPGLRASMTISTTQLETSYLKGGIYGLRISKDLIKAKLFGELNYRNVRYNYGSVDSLLNQHISSLNLSWRILKKLTLSVNYEGVFQTNSIQNRIYANLIQRF